MEATHPVMPSDMSFPAIPGKETIDGRYIPAELDPHVLTLSLRNR